jgi:hypothetical protein
VPANAIAVTGNLTVTNQTAAGYVFLGPVATNSPTSSTLNFPVGDTRANGLTVALGGGGTLSATYVSGGGQTTQLVLDVTGYFTPDATGATYHSLNPTRLLDTRTGNGLSGPFSANIARTFQITGRGGVPANAIAVTGNLTVTNQTAAGYVFLGPVATKSSTSSTLNFPVGDTRANGLTVALGGGGRLSATYVSGGGQTTQLVLDVTGYFTPTSAFVYTQDVYVSGNNHFQATCGWCVVGSALTWLSYISGSTIDSQSTVSGYMTTKDKYPYQSGSCIENGHTYYGHDPRGWAWGMFNYAPAGYHFNDYKIPKTTSGAQASMNWEFVYGVRADSHPDGVPIEAGEHAIDIVGYSAENDLQSLYGFYIFDPWYGRGASGMKYWPYNGFSPNAYIAISTWDSEYYLPDTTDGSFWYNTYDGVLRSTSGTPSNSPPESYGDYIYGLVNPGATPGTGTEAASVASSSIAQAVNTGLQQNGLDSGGNLGVDLTGYKVGTSVHVDSLATGIPSYDLVEIRVSGTVRAVAMVNELAGGYAFGAITPVTSEPMIMSETGVANSLAANGMRGPGRLVWAPSLEGATPFGPFVQGVDLASGQSAYVTMTGRKSTIELSSGLTLSGH